MEGDIFNLLDSFSLSSIDTKKCDEIMKSENPDKHYEYFWLTFKDTILKMSYIRTNSNIELIKKLYISKLVEEFALLIKDVNILSKELNVLQEEKKYTDIKIKINEFIFKNIETLAEIVLHTTDYGDYSYLNTNIMRWDKNFPGFAKYAKENKWVYIVTQLGKFGSKSKHLKHTEYIANLLINIYCTEIISDRLIKYEILFNYGIKHNLSTIVEICISHIDLKKYFPINTNKYTSIRGRKLISLIKSKIRLQRE